MLDNHFPNLKDFVKQTIIQLSQAIDESNKELESLGTVINPTNTGNYVGAKTREIYGYMDNRA